MNMTRVFPIFFPFFALAALADEPFVPCFADVPSVESARIRLHAVGVETFFSEARKANVSPPRIHSKYWVDTLLEDEQEKRRLEYAYRDFGLELAKQLGDKAIDIYDHPHPAAETNRLGWLLDVAEWLNAPGGYGNYRIKRRLRYISGVVLARVITDDSVPLDEIGKQLERIIDEKQDAIERADVLFEESRGEMDVRDMASRFSNDGDFEIPWSVGLRAAYRHFGSMDCLFKYGQCRNRVNTEKTKYSFFCEDKELPRVRSVVNTWDYKQHYTTCIHQGGGLNMDTLRNLYLFRKIVGRLPSIPNSGDEYHDHDATVAIFKEVWRPYEQQYGRIGGGAGSYYYLVTHNKLMDFETEEIVSNRKSMRSVEQPGAKNENSIKDHP